MEGTPPILQRTCIDGLDVTLQGGIPRGSSVLIAGRSGTGKTVLSLQWLFEGATKLDEKGMYFGATENISKVVRNARPFSFFDEAVIDSGDVGFTDLRTIVDLSTDSVAETREDVDELIAAVREIIQEEDLSRIVVDSVSALGYLIASPALYRYLVFRLSALTTAEDCTIFMISEVQGDEGYSRFGIEEFIADGLIELRKDEGTQSVLRRLSVEKLRGTGYRSGAVGFEITGDGIEVYPKIGEYEQVAATDIDDRASTGNDHLDGLMNGGIPRGYTALVAGNTGTGKTTLGLRFILSGLEDGETAVIVNVEEPIEQIRKSAATHGWDLEQYEDDDRLRIVTPDLIDPHPDKTLHDIVSAVEAIDADRLLFDSISTVESALINRSDLREFVLQLNRYLKMRGTTSVMTYLRSALSGGAQEFLEGQTNDLRLSSISDAIVLMRYSQDEDDIIRRLNVLKVRGSRHSTAIHEYTIEPGGLVFRGEPE